VSVKRNTTRVKDKTMADSGKYVQPAIPKFDGHYDHWAKLMENFLRSKEYWHLVEHEITDVSDKTNASEAELKALEEQKLKDLKIKNYLYQAFDREILDTILNDETAKNIWDSMKQKFQGSTRVKRAQLQALRKDFETLHMKEGESVNSYFGQTLKVAKSMKACGENMKENIITAKILRSMTAKFNYVVCFIEESNNMDIMTIDELQSSLLVHEQRMLLTVEEEQVMQAVTDDKSGRGRGRGRSRGGSFRDRGRGRQSFNKAEIQCFKCHKFGHFQYECSTWEKKANYTEVEEDKVEEDELLLMATTDLNEGNKTDWFLDSRCSNHMSGNKDWFSELDETYRHKVKLGNDAQIVVMGRGSVQIILHGITHVFSHVFYVPELKNNLLSIGQLQQKGLMITIQHNKCVVIHPDRGQIMEVSMNDNQMFVLSATIVSAKATCLQVNLEQDSQLWHNRLGHLSYDGLKTLVSKQIVNGLPSITTPKDLCTHCLAGNRKECSKNILARGNKMVCPHSQ